MKRYIVTELDLELLIKAAVGCGEEKEWCRQWGKKEEMLSSGRDHLDYVKRECQEIELPDWACAVCDEHDTKYMLIMSPIMVADDHKTSE